MKTNLLFLCIVLVLLSSCGGNKSVLKDKKLKTKSLKAIVENYDKSSPQFETMRGRLKGEYSDGNAEQSINISYRFKKDEVLWMSAKLAGLIQVAKMIVTANNIQFYERLDQSYFDGDFQFISSVLGLELNYDQLQNLLLGQSIKPIDTNTSDFENLDKYFQITTTFEKGLTQSILLDKKTFKIKQQALNMNDREIKVVYKSYQVINTMTFPEEVIIIAGNKDNRVRLILNYKSINLNDDLKFPFRIPSNFKPIELK